MGMKTAQPGTSDSMPAGSGLLVLPALEPSPGEQTRQVYFGLTRGRLELRIL